MNGIEPHLARIKSVCRHEAGHLVIALHLGFEVHRLQVTFSASSHFGGAELQPWQSGVSDFVALEDYLLRRVKVLLAGVIAEMMTNEGEFEEQSAFTSWNSGTGVVDYKAFMTLMHVLRNIKYPFTTIEQEANEQLKSIHHRLFQSSVQLIKNHIGIIGTIGEELYSRVKQLDEVYEISIEEIRHLPGCADLGLNIIKSPRDPEIAARFF